MGHCKLFFDKLARRIVIKSNAVIVMDNHPSHHSHMVRDALADHGIQVLYLPPNASYLNPIERLWGYFKNELSKMLLGLDASQSADQLQLLVHEALVKLKT